MAKIVVTYTNGRRIEHVMGRETKFARKSNVFNRGTAMHLAKRVCILNESEAERMEVYAEQFPCHSAKRPHTHYTRDEAQKLVDNGDARWVGAGQNVMMFTAGKTWQARMSGGMNVMQMVPGGACY